MISNHRSNRARRGISAFLTGLVFIAAGAVGAGAPNAEGDSAWNFAVSESDSTTEIGFRIRDRIVQARGEIGQGMTENETETKRVRNVATGLSEAAGQLERILEASPAVRIKDYLFGAAQAIPGGDQETVSQKLGGVEGELESVPNGPAVERARAHVKAARDQWAKGNKEAAFESLKAADDQVVLPSRDRIAAETYYLVRVALAALAHEDTTVAAEALKAAEHSAEAYITTTTSEIAVPQTS